MNKRRILVVDDDPDLLFLVAHGIKSLQPDFQVTTAVDGAAALQQVQKQEFDLVITDYMMPEMSGLEMIMEISRVAPETHFIIMTAHHDSQRIRASINEADLKLSGFVSKPFTMPDLLGIVRRAVTQVSQDVTAEPSETIIPKENIHKILVTLRQQTGAHHVLLVDTDGSPVQAAGNIEQAKAFRLGAFISANFLAVIELASLFGDNESIFKSSYYEGNKYNIYAHDVNGSFFLAVVFGAGGKPGTIWFYTKQAVSILAPLLPASDTGLSQDINLTIAEDFDNLLGNEKDS